MQFYRALYFSPNIEHRGTVKWRLQHNAGGLALYVITLCDESLTKTGQQGRIPAAHFCSACRVPCGTPKDNRAGDYPDGIHVKSESEGGSGRGESRENRPSWTQSGNQLQFFHSVFLQSKENRKHCPMIIGLAEGRHEAVEIVRQIVEETWKADGDYDIVRYLAKRDRRIHLDQREDRS